MILQEPDKQIIAMKYQSPQIGTMDPDTLRRHTKALLLKIHVITGWVIEPELKDVLADQFRKHLIESYPNMNVDEIEFAFRKKGTVVKDWGKTFNLSLVDEVLIPYLEERKYASHEIEERKKEPPPVKIYSDEELDNFHRQWTEEFYQRIRSGRVENVPDYSRIILKKDGLIKEEKEADEYFVLALNKKRKNIYVREM
jgi:hypothetical protein